MTTTARPAITAAVCTYQRYDRLAKAVASLTRQAVAREACEILVVDNSPDGERSAEVAREYGTIGNLRWIHEPESGLSVARNRAMAEAGTGIIAFMDDDAVAAPEWLQAAIDAFDKGGADVAAVGGKVTPLWEVPRPEWLADELLIYLSAVDWGGGAPRRLAASEWIVGTNMAFRLDRLREIGGFATDLGRKRGPAALMGNEETDVVRRLTAAGDDILYVPGMVVSHLVAPDRLTQPWFRRRVVWQAVSDYLGDPETAFDGSAGAWQRAVAFAAQLPPGDRTLRSLLVRQPDPRQFRWQLSALYDFTTSSLAGFHGVE